MKILVADDNTTLVMTLAGVLRYWDYDVTVAQDGDGALEALLAPDAPRLALLDWHMPGLDGIEVCRRVRAEPGRPYSYLLLMTGEASREAMLDALEAGADDFLAKPVEDVELKARLGTGRRIAALQERLHVMATRDRLTGLWNRAAVVGLLEGEMPRAAREGKRLAIALADIDHFKAVNDTHGHLAGDAVLREVARRMGGAVRPYDAAGRYGGEEFLLVLPGCGEDEAAALADRLRACISATPIDAGTAGLRVTASVGVAAWDGEASPDDLLRSADEALYRAKRGGRDRVEIARRPRPLVITPS